MDLKDKRRRELSSKKLSAIYHQIGNHLKDISKLYLAFKVNNYVMFTDIPARIVIEYVVNTANLFVSSFTKQ